MGCQGSKAAAVSEKPALTEEAKQKIRESWQMFLEDENLKTNSCLIFVKLFSLAPTAMDLFSFVDDASEESLITNERLHRHVSGVVQAIDTVVQNMDSPELVEKTVSELGERHFSYGVLEEYLGPLAEGVMHALKTALMSRFTKDHEKAWQGILAKIGQHFQKGLREKGGKENNK